MDRHGSLRRAYEPWTDEYNIELIELLRAGRRLGEIAEATGRSEGAVRTQCRNLLPPDLPTSGNAVRTLQALLSDPDYDWREAARARYRRARQVYWDIDMDIRLRSAWADRRRLAELTTEFDASEVEIARQLMRLGLAENPRRSPTGWAATPPAHWPGGSASPTTAPPARSGFSSSTAPAKAPASVTTAQRAATSPSTPTPTAPITPSPTSSPTTTPPA